MFAMPVSVRVCSKSTVCAAHRAGKCNIFHMNLCASSARSRAQCRKSHTMHKHATASKRERVDLNQSGSLTHTHSQRINNHNYYSIIPNALAWLAVDGYVSSQQQCQCERFRCTWMVMHHTTVYYSMYRQPLEPCRGTNAMRRSSLTSIHASLWPVSLSIIRRTERLSARAVERTRSSSER